MRGVRRQHGHSQRARLPAAKRQRLLDADMPQTRREAAKVLALLPKAAALYRQQIADGMHGNVEAGTQARTALREITGGSIKIVRGAKGAVFAEYNMNRVALTGTMPIRAHR